MWRRQVGYTWRRHVGVRRGRRGGDLGTPPLCRRRGTQGPAVTRRRKDSVPHRRSVPRSVTRTLKETRDYTPTSNVPRDDLLRSSSVPAGLGQRTRTETTHPGPNPYIDVVSVEVKHRPVPYQDVGTREGYKGGPGTERSDGRVHVDPPLGLSFTKGREASRPVTGGGNDNLRWVYP